MRWATPTQVIIDLENRPNWLERFFLQSDYDRLYGRVEADGVRWFFADTGGPCPTTTMGEWAGPAAIANEAAWAAIRKRGNAVVLAEIASALKTVAAQPCPKCHPDLATLPLLEPQVTL